jgi:hypothetical protein
MDYTIIIILLFLFVGGYFIYTIIQRQRQFRHICSDEHLYEIRDVFVELYDEVWQEFLQKQVTDDIVDESINVDSGEEIQSLDSQNPNLNANLNANDTTKYRLTSGNFLITYTVTPIKLKNKELIIDHISFSSVNQYFFPRNLVYIAIYFSILLDVKPESFDYIVHQANKGTSGFLFCKTDREGDVIQHKRQLCILVEEESEGLVQKEQENEQQTSDVSQIEILESESELELELELENQEATEEVEIQKEVETSKEEENHENPTEVGETVELKKEDIEDSIQDPNLEPEKKDFSKITLKELRSKIEELSPHIQIQKV